MVKFKVNKNLDKEVAAGFIDLDFGGVDFSKGMFDLHPQLREIKNVSDGKFIKERISKYFDSYYNDHAAELEEKAEEFRKEWGEVEEEFLKLTKQLFKNSPIPEGKYIGYLSIVNCNPRFLEDKTFQVFYNHPKGVKYVTSHELLHFFFYDYAIKKHPEIFSDLDTEESVFWDLAEIFNNIIMAEPRFKELHGQEEIDFYPGHEKRLEELTKLWKENKNVDGWLVRGYELLS